MRTAPLPLIPTPRVILITGASSGIGYEAALACVRRGWRVTATARRADRLQMLVDAAPPDTILAIEADVQDGGSMREAVAQTVVRFGRLDALIANAGVGQRGALVESDWADLETLLRTNIDGVIHSVRAAVPAMRTTSPKDGGQIVIVSSIVATMITPYTALYSASKAFVTSLARSLRLELEPDNIGVSDMRVGRTDTEFNEKRLGTSGRADRAPRLPVMTAASVGEAVARAIERRPRTVVLRPLDRAIMLASALAPSVIGRRALKQYKTT